MVATDRQTRGRGLLHGTQLKLLGLSSIGIRSSRPIYRQIAQALERTMTKGGLASGARLPPERDLASALGVSRATVVQAYRELEARGLVRRFIGRGTFVAAAPDSSGAPFTWRGKVAVAALRTTDSVLSDLLRESSDPRILSVGAGVPALDQFPLEAFRRSLDRVLTREPSLVWGHVPTEGVSTLREAIAHRIGSQPENILVLAGDRKSTRLNSSHIQKSRMPSSA